MSNCNFYPRGQCTWYCCSTWTGGEIGPLWGDGKMWLESAGRAGYRTASSPVVGAIAVWGANMGGTRDAGHVAIVRAVSPLTVAESNWNVPLQPDVRVVNDYSASGIIGYILPQQEVEVVTMGQKRATVFNFRVAAFGEWPPNQASVDAYASQISDDYSNVEDVLTSMLVEYQKNGGHPLWRANLPAPSPVPPPPPQ